MSQTFSLSLKRSCLDSDMLVKTLRGQKKSKKKHKMTFQNLPIECKLYIYSFLTSHEKCKASLTCKAWAEVLQSPCLWKSADFTKLLCCSNGNASEQTVKRQTSAEKFSSPSKGTYYSCPTPCLSLRGKVEDYIKFLSNRNAQLRSLSFEFDILEEKEQWLHHILDLLTNANSSGLEKVFGRWAFTPHFQMRLYNPSLDNKYTRVLSFHKLLQRLAETSRCIRHFRIQFDWSMESVELLSKFQQIHTLELSKYWVFVKTPQSSIDALLDGLPNLRRLRLEMVTPFQQGSAHLLYTLRSPTLEELDIRRSSGFFLLSVNLPNLRSFAAHREYWAGPVLSRQYLNIPCLHTVLKNGAHNLKLYNGYPMNMHWREQTTIMLEEELKCSCYCPRHKKGDVFF